MEKRAHMGDIHQNMITWIKQLDFCKAELG